jgi:glycine/D-amino acid oxidase-like deaminating enzyme
MPDVLIIGGGVIGAACASELARRGAEVTLV